MSKYKRRKSFTRASESAVQLINPILHKKAGLNMRLIENWAEIVGTDIAESALPLKIVWPRQTGAEVRAGGLEAGMLVIGCFGYTALQIQHKTTEIQARINRFFGYAAIGKIRIDQKNFSDNNRLDSARQSAVSGGLLGGFSCRFTSGSPARVPVSAKIQAAMVGIEDEALRAALLRLGQMVQNG